jgi:fatty-acyl-CoA synthase
MNGLMMNLPLTVLSILKRAEVLFGKREIVSQTPDKHFHRYTYRDMARRAKKLAVALKDLGVRTGDRVGTLCWNHHQHLEAYYGIMVCGGVLHTLNLRLHPTDLSYIVNHAGDKVIIVDESLLPLLDAFRKDIHCERFIVLSSGNKPPPGMLDFEQIVEAADESKYREPDLDENWAATMCYTSGTTGCPKGVVYSHRAIALQSMVMGMVDVAGLSERDVAMPVVPMFHVNAWVIPFGCTLVGAKQVLFGPHSDAEEILRLLEQERVTITAGVPTIWLGVLQVLDRKPGAYDLSRLRAILCGGSAAPRSMIRAFQERHGLSIMHGWGMTEFPPPATMFQLPNDLCDAPLDAQYDYRAKQGRTTPFHDIRARGAEGIVPWDGKSVGELEVRGPWVASAYYDCPEGAASFTPDGWFRTGDIVSIHPNGCIEIQDRAKDVIKSGGEWISSVALENALMGHPAVAEAAVIAVAHPKWQERPLAVVVLKEGQTATAQELLAYLEPNFAKWWLPDAIVFAREIPRTTAGKFLKRALRDKYQDYLCPAETMARR